MLLEESKRDSDLFMLELQVTYINKKDYFVNRWKSNKEEDKKIAFNWLSRTCKQC